MSTAAGLLDIDQWLHFDEETKLAVAAVNIIVLGLVSLIGVISNIINMTIFTRLTLKDSMSVELFSLAFADFSATTLELSITCIYVASQLYPWSSVDLWALGYVSFAWAVNASYLISSWITAMISLERCVSVVFPFRVKQMFTRRRCLAIIGVIYVVHIIIFIPAYIIEKMEWVVVSIPSRNSSDDNKWTYTIVFSEATQQLDTVLDITAGLFLFITAQVVIFGCSVWMTFSLKVSSFVRSKTTSVEKFHSTDFSQLTRSEKRMVRIVLFLSLLHTVCNLPRLTLTVFYHVYPWTSVNAQSDFLSLVWTAIASCSTVTCSYSFCGYYRLNSRYRAIFINIFRRT
ncbi:mu-type opioid receptor [Biomphalaria pfeifferi]|uniref:Mu-type opioid receptor n=1 Tax=Biomphalaria pfeifferi TaxID=112525 RepID=A0AAD8AZD4_BIOPF|nr:mu-type opioid receptor [Biomphalaria pfeifferi]